MADFSPMIRTLRDGKAELRRKRIAAPLEDKLRELVKLQHVYVQIVGRRRALKPRERPWRIDG